MDLRRHVSSHACSCMNLAHSLNNSSPLAPVLCHKSTGEPVAKESRKRGAERRSLWRGRKNHGIVVPWRGGRAREADGDRDCAAGDRDGQHPGVRAHQPDPPAPVRVPLLRGRHEPAGGGAPLLLAPQRGRAAVPRLRRSGRRRAAHRRGVPRHGEGVPDAARRREAAVALARVRGQERRALLARRAGRRGAPGHGGRVQDLRQDHPFLAGGPRRRAPARAPADHDGAHARRTAPAGHGGLRGEEVRRVVPEGEGEQGVHERTGARHPPARQRRRQGPQDPDPRGRYPAHHYTRSREGVHLSGPIECLQEISEILG